MARSIITIDDLSNDDMEHLFAVAEEFLTEMADPAKPYRIRGRKHIADQFVLATLFFEPSTRTRFSFEGAMVRLGGGVISSPNSTATSAAKGESIADTVRVIENYADLIVIRHPSEGAARVAAQYAGVPVVNAGDGSHEHPTQTLCDLFTLRQEMKMRSLEDFRDLNVVLYGDLKHGRTVHSLVFALARLGARIIPMPAKGLDLPPHVIRRLHRDYGCTATKTDNAELGLPVDLIYVTPQAPHRRALWREVEELEQTREMTELSKHLKRDLSKIHVFYVTRLQTERLAGADESEPYRRIDHEFLKEKRYKDSRVLHPLPRVSELGYDLDDDPRGVYFRQAAFGVSVRMALLAWLLELKLPSSPTTAAPKYAAYSHADGIRCGNANCVTRHQNEHQHLTPTFWIVEQDGPIVLRCQYCEYEWKAECVGKASARKYTTDDCKVGDIAPDDLILFASAQDAAAAGYHPKKDLTSMKDPLPAQV